MSDAERISELKIELAEIRAAKSRLLKVGQGRSIGDGKSSHQFTEVTYSDLCKREKEIIAELKMLGDNDDRPHGGAIVLGGGW